MAAITLTRVGDFYVAYSDDARTIARELGLTLTTKGKSPNVVPMAGFPYHQLDSYTAKLRADGHEVSLA